MQKVEGSQELSETQTIMTTLAAALNDWQPNVIQVLMSEIQNALELEGFAGSDSILRRPDMQAALTYNLLKDLGPLDLTKNASHRVPVMNLVDKVIDSIRGRLSAHEGILNLVEKALVGQLKSMRWPPEKWPKGTKLVIAARELARVAVDDDSTILFRLNHFLSTEKFKRAHLTTGTIFYHSTKDEYFVVASPACDLVAGQNKTMQTWAQAISPIMPVVAIRLEPALKLGDALGAAAQAEFLFIEVGDKPKAFKVTNGVGHQPSYEVIFVQNEGRVRTKDGKTVFDGARLILNEPPLLIETPMARPEHPQPAGGDAAARASNHPTKIPSVGGDASIANHENIDSRMVFEYDTFEIVEQLRGVNATHVLQLTGQHLSRIGLDFVSTPRN